VSLAVRSDQEWAALCRVIGDPALGADPRFATLEDRQRNEDALEARITEWTTAVSAEEATKRLQASGIAAFPSMTNRDLAEDVHLNQRGFFVDLPHPEVGPRHHAGMPWRLSETPCAVERPAPCLGQHNREVLETVLGYSTSEVEELSAAGALG
jgi:crotonobetainyl-CoA:carnitine CoA-transferase CaiB-like acyl-CoA transferase